MIPAAGSLRGIRVLDAGMSVQGPLAAQLLGDLGAEVVKVEMPGVGDPARWVLAAPRRSDVERAARCRQVAQLAGQYAAPLFIPPMAALEGGKLPDFGVLHIMT